MIVPYKNNNISNELKISNCFESKKGLVIPLILLNYNYKSRSCSKKWSSTICTENFIL